MDFWIIAAESYVLDVDISSIPYLFIFWYVYKSMVIKAVKREKGERRLMEGDDGKGGKRLWTRGSKKWERWDQEAYKVHCYESKCVFFFQLWNITGKPWHLNHIADLMYCECDWPGIRDVTVRMTAQRVHKSLITLKSYVPYLLFHLWPWTHAARCTQQLDWTS